MFSWNHKLCLNETNHCSSFTVFASKAASHANKRSNSKCFNMPQMWIFRFFLFMVFFVCRTDKLSCMFVTQVLIWFLLCRSLLDGQPQDHQGLRVVPANPLWPVAHPLSKSLTLTWKVETQKAQNITTILLMLPVCPRFALSFVFYSGIAVCLNLRKQTAFIGVLFWL